MSLDLFGTGELSRIPLEGAELRFSPQISLPCDDRDLLAELLQATPWRQEEVFLWGKRHLQPRLVAWYGDKGRSYAYSGIRLAPLPWTGTLQTLKAAVERLTASTFNSVLLNLYRDQNDSMGFHSDDEKELGNQPTIASLSLGDTRTLVFQPKNRQLASAIKLPLTSGSLLLMSGDTQKNWKHGILKQARPCTARINLTFRLIHSEESSRT